MMYKSLYAVLYFIQVIIIFFYNFFLMHFREVRLSPEAVSVSFKKLLFQSVFSDFYNFKPLKF